MKQADKDWMMIRMVGGWMFLLVRYRLTQVVMDKGP